MADTRAPYDNRWANDGLPLEEALDRGLDWLLRTEQPEGAIVSHHGDSLKCHNNRRLIFVPAGSVDNRCPVIVLEVRAARRRETSHDRPLATWGLAPHEMDHLTALLAERGHEVTSTWNGFPASSGSVALGKESLHPTMAAALENYRKGCAAHGGSVFCNCDLFREGFTRLKPLRSPREVTTL